MAGITDWLEAHQVPCFYKHYLCVECPGCGMQTAIILLLKGDIAGSIIAYPALIPTIFLLVYLFLHLIFNFKKGAIILKISFIFTVVIMFTNYVIKFSEIWR